MTHTRSVRSRALAGLATFATVAAVSIPLMATAASAAVSSVTANPATYQFSSPGSATVTADVVRTVGDVTPIRFLVTAGPDADKAANGATTSDGDCTPPAPATTVNCTYGNTVPGVDTVRVFADSNLNQILDAGEPFSDATVSFYGAAANVNLSPDADTAAAGTCNVFTVTVTDAGGRTRPGQAVKLEATLTGTLGARTLSFCNPATTNPTSTNAGGDDTTAGTGAPTQAQGTVTTDSTGRAAFGIRSDQPGTATVRAYVDANSSGTFDGSDPGDLSNKTFTSGGTGTTAADAVTTLTVNPTAQTVAVGDSVKYVVTARNSSSDTTPNVAIQYQITGANPSTGTLTPTDNGGAATLTYTATNAGTDTVKFWVNQTTAVPNTSGPDASEPQATATTTIPVAPTGYTIDLTCTGTVNTTAEDCREPLTHKSEVFTAKVTKGGIAQAGVPVRFTAVNSTAPGSPTPATFSGVTDSTGKLVFNLSDATAQNGTIDTVTAAIAGQSVPEAGGVSSDSGTVKFETAAATNLTLTPALQTTQTGTASTFTATLTDQFGVPVSGANVDFKITGRNAALSPALLDKTTDANGQASITYTDIGPLNTAGTDTVDAWADIVNENDVQNGSEPTDSSVNNFITEPAVAGTVDLDVKNVGACGSTPDPANDTMSYNPAVTGTTHPVCALIKTAGNAPLAGKTVTFTLTGVGGFVKPDGTVIGSTTTAVTDGTGVANVLVASTLSGAQNITATIDNKSDQAVITYNAATPGSARFIDLTPNTGNIAPGQSNELTAKVTDVFGNPVAGITVDFTEVGGGTFGNATSSQSGVTGQDGTVSVSLTSPAGTTGTDTVTASINATQAGASQCNKPVNDPFTGAKAGNCSDTSTYTFKNTTPLSFIIGTSVIKAGQFTKVVITGTPGDHVQVLCKGAGAPGYTVIANLTIGSGGGTFLSISPSTSSNYEVRNATTTVGPKFLLVKAVQSINVAKSGGTGIFTGLVKPSVQNRAVYVYYYVDGGHVQQACKAFVQPGGKFHCNRSGFHAGQLIHVFAQTGADIYNAAGRSGLKDLQF